MRHAHRSFPRWAAEAWTPHRGQLYRPQQGDQAESDQKIAHKAQGLANRFSELAGKILPGIERIILVLFVKVGRQFHLVQVCANNAQAVGEFPIGIVRDIGRLADL